MKNVSDDKTTDGQESWYIQIKFTMLTHAKKTNSKKSFPKS